MKGTKMETKIKEVRDYFEDQLKEKFNEEKFNQDVRAGKKISFENVNEYRKDDEEERKEDKGEKFNGRGLSFKSSFKNGEYVAIGSNGHVVKSKNIDDVHRKLAQVFKVHALKRGLEPFCNFYVDKDDENKEALSESFARTFINAGVVVGGDVPKSAEFWGKLKQDYLSKEGCTLENWNRLTRFVPKEYMGQGKTTQYPSHTKQVRTTGSQKMASLASIARSQGGR